MTQAIATEPATMTVEEAAHAVKLVVQTVISARMKCTLASRALEAANEAERVAMEKLYSAQGDLSKAVIGESQLEALNESWRSA